VVLAAVTLAIGGVMIAPVANAAASDVGKDVRYAIGGESFDAVGDPID